MPAWAQRGVAHDAVNHRVAVCAFVGAVDLPRERVPAIPGPRHVPAVIVAVADIPRTKSGKIVELAVRNVVHNRPVKNVEALANPEALEFFRGRVELMD